MSEPIIKFEKVVKSFGPITVLNELDFEVAAGRKGDDHRTVRFRQVDRAAHPDDAREDQ